MSWYTIALKQEEFYEFYALQGLSDDVLKDNPVILFEFIEKINDIRAYYLDYLLRAIANELAHATMLKNDVPMFDKTRDEKAVEKYCDLDESRVNKESHMWIVDPDTGETELDEKSYAQAIRTLTMVVLKEEYEVEVQALCVKLLNGSASDSDMIRIRYFFNDLPWGYAFGGKSWAEITKWTAELQKNGPITNSVYNLNLIHKIRTLVMAIDVLHSLEHNTANVLSNLPNDEVYWMKDALNIVMIAENPANLATFSDNPKLSELYRREQLPLDGKQYVAHDKDYFRHLYEKKQEVWN